jgi:hypothetical protein
MQGWPLFYEAASIFAALIVASCFTPTSTSSTFMMADTRPLYNPSPATSLLGLGSFAASHGDLLEDGAGAGHRQKAASKPSFAGAAVDL